MRPSPTSTLPIIGRNGGLVQVMAQVERLRSLPIAVLIKGESGTGKEVIARALHAGGPFVAVNCAALPPGLLESDLFGHRRGSFTGAHADRAGLFEQARGGTLLLDEIGELPLELQPKLLRVLQEGAVRRLGEAHERPVETRLLSATQGDLRQEMRQGRFRADLFYRLAEFELQLPPLRRRRRDIRPLAEYFLRRYSREYGKEGLCGLSVAALDWLEGCDWADNNVRQLSVTLKRAVVRCDGRQLELRHLEDAAMPPAPRAQRDRDFQRRQLRAALEDSGGNIAAAARALGMKRSTLFDRLDRLGLRPSKSADGTDRQRLSAG